MRLQHTMLSMAGLEEIKIKVLNNLVNNKVELMHVYSTLYPNSSDHIFFSNAMDMDNFEKLITYSFYGLIKLTLWVKGNWAPTRWLFLLELCVNSFQGPASWPGLTLSSSRFLSHISKLGDLLFLLKLRNFFIGNKAKLLIAKQERERLCCVSAWNHH